MKVKLHEAANWKTTPDHRGIIHIGDDSGEGMGDDGVVWWGQIFCPGNWKPQDRFRFRANQDAPDFTAEMLFEITARLRLLDSERDAVLAR